MDKNAKSKKTPKKPKSKKHKTKPSYPYINFLGYGFDGPPAGLNIDDLEAQLALDDVYDMNSMNVLRREKVLKLPIAGLLSIAAGKAVVYLPASIPTNAIPVRIFTDSITDSLCVVLTHPDFELVPPGGYPSIHDAIVTYPEDLPKKTVVKPAEAALNPTEPDTSDREV